MKLLTFLLITLTTLVAAEEVATGFSYQGELLDNGSPANGEFDIHFGAFDAATEGTIGINQPEFLNVTVSNGLFHIAEVDFGEAQFIGEEVWVEVSVRKSAEGGDYSPLSPRQKIAVAPYAVQSRYAIDAYTAGSALTADHATTANSATHATEADSAIEAQSLAAGNANMTDILQFDGLNWIPVPMNQISPSPWNSNGTDLFYTNGNVGVGTNSPSTEFHVQSASANELTRFDGGSRMYNTFYENGISRGYIGSYQSSQDADFDLGTSSGNNTGSLHLTTQATPRLTVDKDGQVAINSTNPQARLQVEGEANESAFRVRHDGSTRLWIKNTGDTHIYGQLTSEGITVLDGQTTANHNVKQNNDRNGLVKYMVKFSCGGNDPSSITSYVNNTNTPGAVTIEEHNNDNCALTFPTDVHSRYHIATTDSSWGAINGSCVADGPNNELRCGVWNNLSESPQSVSPRMVLVIY